MKCFLDGMWRGEEGKRAGAVPRPNRFREPAPLQPQNTPVLIRELCTWPGRAWKVWKGGLALGKLTMPPPFFFFLSGSIRHKAKGKAGWSKPATNCLDKVEDIASFRVFAGGVLRHWNNLNAYRPTRFCEARFLSPLPSLLEVLPQFCALRREIS